MVRAHFFRRIVKLHRYLTDSPYGGMFDINGINNPAWCLYDFLTNTRYGAGIPESLIDMESFPDSGGAV